MCKVFHFYKKGGNRLQHNRFFPNKFNFPNISLIEHLRKSSMDIVRILSQPLTSTVFSLQKGYLTLNALLILAKLLKRVYEMLESIVKNKNMKYNLRG